MTLRILGIWVLVVLVVVCFLLLFANLGFCCLLIVLGLFVFCFCCFLLCVIAYLRLRFALRLLVGWWCLRADCEFLCFGISSFIVIGFALRFVLLGWIDSVICCGNWWFIVLVDFVLFVDCFCFGWFVVHCRFSGLCVFGLIFVLGFVFSGVLVLWWLLILGCGLLVFGYSVWF